MRGRVIKQINNIKLLYLANYKQFAIIKKNWGSKIHISLSHSIMRFKYT